MSVVLAAIASRISNRMWVQTEELELYHYIAIREEFDRVDAALKHTEEQSTRSPNESIYGFDRAGFRIFCDNVKQWVRYPLLKRKHDRLLVQVRFHELRVHFLKANDLPLKFPVSQYLKKSETHVFKKLVRTSTFALGNACTFQSFVNPPSSTFYYHISSGAYIDICVDNSSVLRQSSVLLVGDNGVRDGQPGNRGSCHGGYLYRSDDCLRTSGMGYWAEDEGYIPTDHAHEIDQFNCPRRGGRRRLRKRGKL
mmetsp:Transcript_13693/g.40033  ORF Transcript_13693/g.40033 Transcript_13693/m.40033 type:complete len:253 (+) Transcript_13693:830-1588(+)